MNLYEDLVLSWDWGRTVPELQRAAEHIARVIEHHGFHWETPINRSLRQKNPWRFNGGALDD
jgi:hypothetical protein